MDYLGVLSVVGSGPQGAAGREILAELSPVPEKLTKEWCEAHAAEIDAWLVDTEGTVQEEAVRTYTAVKPLLTTKAVRRLRMFAADSYATFPDCTFRALVTVAKKYNTIKSARAAAKLSELCKLYALQVRMLLKRHEQVSKFVYEPQLSALRSAVEGDEYDPALLATLFEVPVESVPAELKRYMKRADETLWVLQGDPL